MPDPSHANAPSLVNSVTSQSALQLHFSRGCPIAHLAVVRSLSAPMASPLARRLCCTRSSTKHTSNLKSMHEAQWHVRQEAAPETYAPIWLLQVRQKLRWCVVKVDFQRHDGMGCLKKYPHLSGLPEVFERQILGYVLRPGSRRVIFRRFEQILLSFRRRRSREALGQSAEGFIGIIGINFGNELWPWRLHLKTDPCICITFETKLWPWRIQLKIHPFATWSNRAFMAFWGLWQNQMELHLLPCDWLWLFLCQC